MIETTDFNKSEQYTLSIRLSTDGFSFSVFNPLGDGEFSYYDREVDESLSLTANLKQTFRELEWLKRPFRRVPVPSAIHLLFPGNAHYHFHLPGLPGILIFLPASRSEERL